MSAIGGKADIQCPVLWPDGLSQIPVVRPAGIIAQRIHLGAASTDHMQQIWQPHICTVLFDELGLAVLARAVAFPA